MFKLGLQSLGCLIPVALLLVLLERTGRSHWQAWLTAAAGAILVFAMWAVIGRWRGRRLDAEYGFSIVNEGMRSARIQAFYNGVPAFSIPFDLDQIPPCVQFTAALIDIPDSDADAWRERLSEYMKRRWGRCVII